MNNKRKKLVMGIVAATAWFALIIQLILMLKTVNTAGFSTLKTLTNFFSYFTILSNLLVAVCLTSVLITPLSKAGSFFSKAGVQSGIAVYIFIVGLVYNLVLRSIWNPKGWQLVADNLLHVSVPLLYIIYWFFYTPKKVLHWKAILPWLLFPALYLAWSLLRGPVADWYPYPFIHAGNLGYVKVAINSLFVLIAILLTGLGLVAINRRK